MDWYAIVWSAVVFIVAMACAVISLRPEGDDKDDEG
jgi:hypothetical protein